MQITLDLNCVGCVIRGTLKVIVSLGPVIKYELEC